MNKLSEYFSKNEIEFSFPIKVHDGKGEIMYFENDIGILYTKPNRVFNNKEHGISIVEDSVRSYRMNSCPSLNSIKPKAEKNNWRIRKLNSDGLPIYCEDIDGRWYYYEYDENGNETYFTDNKGAKRGKKRTPCALTNSQ